MFSLYVLLMQWHVVLGVPQLDWPTPPDFINHVAWHNNAIGAQNEKKTNLRMGRNVVVPGILDHMQGSWRGTRENPPNDVMVDSRVLTAPRAVNTRAQNEYPSRMTCMLNRCFYFQWFRWTRTTLRVSRVCVVVALVLLIRLRWLLCSVRVLFYGLQKSYRDACNWLILQYHVLSD